ncbi:unnamed protein product [Urochloa decumbens]|uniref:Uncharacterized protein n=1 Tax=Urochloa decumbens TaxID=240449 RepID=A0ABC9G2Y1_9POAL
MEPGANLLLLPQLQARWNRFWFWEEEYLKVLQTKGVAVRALQADDSRMEVAGTKQQGVESRRQEGVEFNGTVSVKEARELAAIGKEAVSLLTVSVKEARELAAIGKEAVSLLKGICFVGVCMLLLVFAIFCLMLFK